MSKHILNAARAVADLSAGSILATVEIAAPPERVFQAMTTGEEIVRWWGSEGAYRTTQWKVDLRPGGTWRADGKGADGKTFSVGGRILEVDPPRKLVQTWKSDWDPGPETTVSFRFDPIDGGTRLTLRHEGFVEPGSCQSHADGWQQILEWLVAHLRGRADGAKKHYLCRLIPPRPSFAFDMTPAEAEAMKKHVAYWTRLAGEGTAIAFGPVGDPKGPWGMGLLAVKDEAELRELQGGDPAIAASIGLKYEVHPMLSLVVG
jgi:uncharacterized protein YndB with AHSA1/START domain